MKAALQMKYLFEGLLTVLEDAHDRQGRSTVAVERHVSGALAKSLFPDPQTRGRESKTAPSNGF